MYTLKQTTRFKKDLKAAKKRGLDVKLLDTVITSLVTKGKIQKKYLPHRLKGKYLGYWECHIMPDWLLIWKQEKEIKLITLIRTGSHSQLFDK